VLAEPLDGGRHVVGNVDAHRRPRAERRDRRAEDRRVEGIMLLPVLDEVAFVALGKIVLRHAGSFDAMDRSTPRAGVSSESASSCGASRVKKSPRFTSPMLTMPTSLPPSPVTGMRRRFFRPMYDAALSTGMSAV